MAVPNPQVRFTYDDFQSLPESTGKRYELLDGEIVMVPAPGTTHQRVARDLGFLLMAHVRAHHLGEVLYAPVDVVFGQGELREVVEPDLLFVRQERRAIITPKEVVGAPDLIVEVLSPATRQRDRGYKRALYGRYGVPEYWIADPDTARMEVYRLGDQGLVLARQLVRGEVLESPLLPGLGIEVGEVFLQIGHGAP